MFINLQIMVWEQRYYQHYEEILRLLGMFRPEIAAKKEVFIVNPYAAGD